MEPLRVRSADTAPGIGTPEYFGQVPRSIIADVELSDGATRCYAAIRLRMAEEESRAVYLGTMSELGRLMGVTEREARRRVAELERRGHVARERIRSIAGSPQAIRPLATLRGRARRPAEEASTRTKWSDCNRTDQPGTPDRTDRAPGPNGPPDRTDPSDPPKREGEETSEQQESGPAATVVALSLGSREPEETPSRAGFLRSLAADLAATLRPPTETDPPAGRAKRSRGPSAKTTPGTVSRDSVPDARDRTTEPEPASRSEHGTEHKCR